MVDILDDLRSAQKSDEIENGPDKTHLFARAIAEIERLRKLVGAVSDLPAEDQAKLDKVYGKGGTPR
jgi:hypothetical protein